MITAKNYFEEIGRVGVNNLPQTLQELHNYVVRATENGTSWDTYNNSEKIKKVIDLYFQKLNEFALTEERKTKQRSETKSEGSTKTPRQPTNKTKQVRRASSHAVKDSKVQSLSVEHIREEVKFVKRFVALHNKVKSPKAILAFIKALQRSIIQKLIRKTSPLAEEISMIQDKLIKVYKKMRGDESFEINQNDLPRLVAIAGGEKVYPSINIMKQFIGMQGKIASREMIESLKKQIEKAFDNKKISKDDPYHGNVKRIFNALRKIKTGKVIDVAEKARLNGLAGIVQACACQSGKSDTNQIRVGGENIDGLNGVLTAEQMANRKLDLLNFTSFWAAFFGMPGRNFTLMLHGEPHNGKTILLLKFAQYLADNFGEVLYVSSEEFSSTTMSQKVKEFLSPFPQRLHFAENLTTPDLTRYQFVILDSVNDLGLKIGDYKQLRKDHPNTAFILILQHTKAGDYRGGKDWEHTVEIAGEVSKGVVTITRNRYGPKTSFDFFKEFGLQWEESNANLEIEGKDEI